MPIQPTIRSRTVLANTLSVLCALAIAGGILLGTTYAVVRLRASEIYSKSRMISMIVSQDQINLTDMAGNKRNVDMMLKFVGALTSAYINFEMIPVGEVGTFIAVFESAAQDITIDKFAYHRKNLSIQGGADDEEAYLGFLDALRETGQFENVTGHYYLSTDDTIRFEIECAAYTTTALLEF